MRAPWFFIICVVASFAIADAVPWYRRNPTNINQEVAESDNGGSDFGVEEFGVNAGDTARKSGGGLTNLDPENKDADPNQDVGEGVDEQGGEGNQGSRRFQGGRGYQGRRRSQGGPYTGGRFNLGDRGYPGGRGNQNDAGDSGGGLTNLDPENKDADPNQDVGEGVDEQGGEGNQGSRRFQGGRGYQGRRRSQGGPYTGGRFNLGDRGYPGGRGNQNDAGDSDYEDSHEELSARKNVIAARWLPKYRNYGYQNRHQYGYGVRFPSSVESGLPAANFGEPDDIDLYHRGNRPYGNEEDESWQKRNPGRRGNPNGRRLQVGGEHQDINRNQFGGVNHGTNGNQYGNQNEGDDYVENNENPDGVQNPNGDFGPNGVKRNPADINNYDGDKGLSTERQSSDKGQNVNKGQAGEVITANKNRSRNKDGGRHANWSPTFLNLGNGEGNKNKVYF